MELIKPIPDERKPYAEAYVNHGRWIADCNRPYCNNAMDLEPRQTRFYCSNCAQEATLRWPSDVDDIWSVLKIRPVPQTRNWFPRDHRLALLAGCPHGQTVADLIAENHAYGVRGTTR